MCVRVCVKQQTAENEGLRRGVDGNEHALDGLWLVVDGDLQPRAD